MESNLIIWEPTYGGLTGYFAGGVFRLSRAYSYAADVPKPIGWQLHVMGRSDEQLCFVVPGGRRVPVEQRPLAPQAAGGGQLLYFISVGDALRAAQQHARQWGKKDDGNIEANS